MPYVNLIQEQRLAAQANERKARSFFFLFVGVLVVSGGAFGAFSMDAMLVSHKAALIDAENKKNAPIVTQIDKNAKDLADLMPRLKTLEDAGIITGRWDRVLSHLSVQTPSSTWLTGLRCQGSDPTKPIQISLVGVGAAQSPIGEYIMRLQNSSDLENVHLKYTNEKLISTQKAVEFEVDCDIAGSAEQKAKVESTGDDNK
jgi:Tfp pilus assembly protein PilN